MLKVQSMKSFMFIQYLNLMDIHYLQVIDEINILVIHHSNRFKSIKNGCFYSSKRSTDNNRLSQPLINYSQEMTLTALDLVLTGTCAAFPDVKIILSQTSGTLLFLAHHITMVGFLHCPHDAHQILTDFH